MLIVYLFYNADLLDNSTKKGIEAQKFINNITLIAMNKSTKDNNHKLAKVYNSVYKDWRVKHGSKFSIPKYQLIYISRKQGVDYKARLRLRREYVI